MSREQEGECSIPGTALLRVPPSDGPIMSVALGEAAMFENGTLYRHLYASLWGSQTIQRMRVSVAYPKSTVFVPFDSGL